MILGDLLVEDRVQEDPYMVVLEEHNFVRGMGLASHIGEDKARRAWQEQDKKVISFIKIELSPVFANIFKLNLLCRNTTFGCVSFL